MHLINLYPGISREQLAAFFPGKSEKISTLLTHLQRQRRVQTYGNGYVPYSETATLKEREPQKAVWVLLDFYEQVEFHCTGDFPVQIVFFASGELYEIVYAALGQEALISNALCCSKHGDGRRLVLVDEPGQISRIRAPDITGYCTVDGCGRVNYFKKGNGGN